MLHHGEQPVLLSFVLTERAYPQLIGHELVFNGQHFGEIDVFLHFDGSVPVDEPFQLEDQDVRQLLDLLLVEGFHLLAVQLVVVDHPLLEEGVQTTLQVLTLTYLQTQDEERLTLYVYLSLPVHIELRTQESSENVSDQGVLVDCVCGWVLQNLLGVVGAHFRPVESGVCLLRRGGDQGQFVMETV